MIAALAGLALALVLMAFLVLVALSRAGRSMRRLRVEAARWPIGSEEGRGPGSAE